MDETKTETLDLSKRGLKKIEKAPADNPGAIINLILDHNELQRLDNIETYSRLENLSISNNFLMRMHGVSRLTNIRVLALNNNAILQIEGLKDLLFLKALKLAGNNIKSIEHLNHNIHLEYLDLSNNQISFIADISYLKSLKHLNLERNRIIDLRQCDRYIPTALEHLGLGGNNIQDLNEISHLVHLNNLDSITIQGNPCVAMAGKDKLGFDYRPFVLNWILSLKSIDGFIVSAIENLKAEWLYSQGKGRHYHTGQHSDLCEYLASTCPLTADALDTEDQRKLRIILSKAQHHQQQLKDQTNSPIRTKMQSPRMQSRITTRHMGRSPDRLSSSYHSAVTKCSSPSSLMSMSCTGEVPSNNSSISQAMSQSFDSPGLVYSMNDRHGNCRQEVESDKIVKSTTQDSIPRPINQSLEAASKMVPVPESLMSPDYQDPLYDLQRNINKGPTNNTSNHSSQSSNSSIKEPADIDPKHRSILNKNMRGSPKLTRSAMSSPKLRTKSERKGSLTRLDGRSSDSDSTKTPINNKINGVTKQNKTENSQNISDTEVSEKLEIMRLASNQRRQKKFSAETLAAVTIQKMWRGYRSRNLNKDTLRILHAIQAARARQHIQRLTCDMEATKAALDSERKIQQLQMQAINALWKKVSTIQTNDVQKQKNAEHDDNAEVLRQLTATCFNLQAQVVELQGCMREVLRAVGAGAGAQAAATQTDATPQEEKCNWLRRPQSLAISSDTAPVPPSVQPSNFSEDQEIKIEDNENQTESLIEEKPLTEIHSISDNEPQTDTIEEKVNLLVN